MTDYLSKSYDWQTDEIAFTFDDFSLWSSVPGNLLLDNISYRKNQIVLDVGFGTGFPLLHLAARFGDTSKIIGVDIWENAISQATQKIKARDIQNVTLLNNDAAQMEIETASVDLITSNLGINNFENTQAVIKECWRVLKPGGQLILSSNLVGSFAEFYEIFENTIKLENDLEIIAKLQEHITHRVTVERLNYMFSSEGFKTLKTIENSFNMKYVDGSTFLNEYSTIMCFLPFWKAIIPTNRMNSFFAKLEKNLNDYAEKNGELKLTIPIVVMSFQKIKK